MHYQQREEHDAIVVGSGMSGGWAMKELCEKGLKTLVLERGRMVEPGVDYITEHKQPWEVDYRGRVPPEVAEEEYSIQRKTYAFSGYTRHYFINDKKNPYIQEEPYTWIRADVVGGRSILWARQSYRFSDLDFEANLKDGHGVDWPIRYADIAPWYDYIERAIGISGQAEGLPHLPDGQFLPPMEMNAVEKVAKERIEAAFPERTVTIGRVAVLTQPLGERAPCHYCGPCERGCSTRSYYSTQSVPLPAARATGNLTLRPHSIVLGVIYDEATDRATGVRVIDVETHEEMEFYTRGPIFLCASSMGTARIMLNSKSPRFPDGIANSSGALGHYLMDHHYHVGANGRFEGYRDRYYQGNRPNGIYIPRFRNISPETRRSEYVRGFGFQGGASRTGWSRGGGMAGIGEALKQTLRDPGPWTMGLAAFGETLPRYDNYCELADETDQWGLPLLRFHVTRDANDLAMRQDMAASAAEMLEAAGAIDVEAYDQIEDAPGLGNHEMGAARMGRDPQTSVLNAYNQCHDVPNLYVTDGACMTSSACVNPSLTYMALTARAVDHALKQGTS